eukprot:7837907-Heterocapsa_arctica.AAC.1
MISGSPRPCGAHVRGRLRLGCGTGAGAGNTNVTSAPAARVAHTVASAARAVDQASRTAPLGGAPSTAVISMRARPA